MFQVTVHGDTLRKLINNLGNLYLELKGRGNSDGEHDGQLSIPFEKGLKKGWKSTSAKPESAEAASNIDRSVANSADSDDGAVANDDGPSESIDSADSAQLPNEDSGTAAKSNKYSKDEVADHLRQVNLKNGGSAALSVLKEFHVGRIGQLTESQYAAFVSRCRSLVSK